MLPLYYWFLAYFVCKQIVISDFMRKLIVIQQTVFIINYVVVQIWIWYGKVSLSLVMVHDFKELLYVLNDKLPHKFWFL